MFPLLVLVIIVTIDIGIARMFWKSFSLSPPIESKLFSPDIKQRRRTATASGKRK